MSNQPFSFPPPPPPPPPPKPTVDPAQQRNDDFTGGRGGHRGWGGNSYRGQGHSRGGRGNHRGGGRNNSQHYDQKPPFRPSNNSYSRPVHSNHPQKRTHNTAFTPPPNARPRPLAPPPVPSFNATIPHLLPSKPIATLADPTPGSAQGTETAKPPAKKNLLGLTPSLPDGSSSSEDEDEEGRMSTTIGDTSHGQGYTFNHNGRVANLRTAADIQAWIAERRKNFPTAVKAEAAKKAREEQKKKWMEEKEEKRRQWETKKAERQRKYEEEKQARQLARQAAAAERLGGRQGSPKGPRSNEAGVISRAGPAAEVESPAEKLRRRAEKAERALKRAEEALRLVRLKQAKAQAEADGGDEVDDDGDDGTKAVSSQPADPDTAIDPDATSSSGSSDTDSEMEGETGDLSDLSSSGPNSDSGSDKEGDGEGDEAPETVSTKQPTLGQTGPFSSDADTKIVRGSRPCKNLLNRGRCHFGSSCRYSHDMDLVQRHEERSRSRRGGGGGGKAQRGRNLGSTKPERRKGLFQVLVDKEEEDRRKQVVEAIFLLRERGMLDEPVAESTASQPADVPSSS